MSRSIRIILSMVLVAAFICALAMCSAEEDPFKTPGSIVTFGRYPQTAEGTDETPIEWIVLDYDEANHRALLLSKYGLDVKPYNTEYKEVTWERCSLRRWLNRDFLGRAFSSEEMAAIILSDVDNSDTQGYGNWKSAGGKSTQDRIFLLSCLETKRYFHIEHSSVSGSDQNTVSRAAPTAYAIKQGAWLRDDFMTTDGSSTGMWWLRSPGKYQNFAAIVSCNGSLYHMEVSNDECCIRPAMWISVD